MGSAFGVGTTESTRSVSVMEKGVAGWETGLFIDE